MMTIFKTRILIALMLWMGAVNISSGQVRRVPRRPVGGGVAFPYPVADGHGETWTVFQPMVIQLQGVFPVYQQAGAILFQGNQTNMTGQPRLDEKTSELVIENMQLGGFTLTRRILINADDGYARVIDLIKNPQAQDQPLSFQLQSYISFAAQNSQMVPDPKKKTQNLAWVAPMATGNNKAAMDVYASSGAKLYPTIESQPGSNSVEATFTTTIPAQKEIAFAHFHLLANSQDQATAWITTMKVQKLFADLPREIRAEIVNFRANGGLMGDLEVLRGDTLDVVELHGGDKFNGNLTDPAYKLDTFYGTVELPMDKVNSIINEGQFKPRQLIVTTDGQIFGGHLQKPTIDLELTSGQKTQIPLAQISRVGYRHRPDEKDDATDGDQLQPPYVLMASGERVGVTVPPAPVAVVTRYGPLQLTPDVISSIIFNSEESGVHTIELTDGSRFNGLATASEFDAKLTTAGKNQDVKFPIGSLNRIVFNNRPDEKDDGSPLLQLKKDDQLVGSLQGELKLDTAFDTIVMNAPEIRAITHAKESPTDLSVTTWDGTIFSGQLEEQTVQCHLKSGIDVQIPISLLDTYNNPSAAVPAMILDHIKAIVGDLNADDWKQRDDAEHQLVKFGPGVIPTLKQMRDKQPPEAQQRIDSVLKQLQK